MKLEESISRLTNRLARVTESTRQQKFDELFKEYTTLYPRLVQKPEQRDLLEQMLKLYVHINFDLWPAIESLWQTDKKQYKMIAGIFLKTMQQWDREMSRLGFTFTSQPYVPMADRKTYDPKAVVQLKERVKELTETVTEQLGDVKDQEELLKIRAKKKDAEKHADT